MTGHLSADVSANDKAPGCGACAGCGGKSQVIRIVNRTRKHRLVVIVMTTGVGLVVETKQRR